MLLPDLQRKPFQRGQDELEADNLVPVKSCLVENLCYRDIFRQSYVCFRREATAHTGPSRSSAM